MLLIIRGTRLEYLSLVDFHRILLIAQLALRAENPRIWWDSNQCGRHQISPTTPLLRVLHTLVEKTKPKISQERKKTGPRKNVEKTN